MTSAHGSNGRRVVLESAGGRREIHGEDVYFAFASGRFAYDCSTCRAQCCRGFGYEIKGGEEMRTHLTTAPMVRFFVEPCESERHYHVKNLAPACFFLQSNFQCGVQNAHGYAAKPETCRLFPFNDLALAGRHLIVAPHSSLCPLDIAPTSTASPVSEYEHLVAELSASPISLHIRPLPLPASQADAMIALERHIVALSETHLGDDAYLSFAAAQAQAAEASGTPLDARDHDESSDLNAFRGAVFEVLGLTPAAVSSKFSAVSPTLVAATPALRLRLLYPQATAKHVDAVRLDRVPRILLALEILAAMAGEAGMDRVTYQSISGLFQQHQALLHMLSHAHTVMTWRPDVEVDLSFSGPREHQNAYARIVKALTAGSQQRTPASLARILSDHVIFEGVPRVVFLKRLAGRLAGRLAPLGTAGKRTLRTYVSRPRIPVQHWAMRHLPEEALLAVGDRITRQRRSSSPHHR